MPLKAGHAQNSMGNHLTYEYHPLTSSPCYYIVILQYRFGTLLFISYLILLLNVSMTERKTFYIKIFLKSYFIFKLSEQNKQNGGILQRR